MEKRKTEKTTAQRKLPVFIRTITSCMFLALVIESVFVVINTCAIAWYSTIMLQIPYSLEELAQELAKASLGAIGAKVLGNIFEHNEGGLFGKSTKNQDDEEGA